MKETPSHYPIRLTTLRTGSGFNGVRIAELPAPPDAPPSSLVALREFLTSQGIRTLPGYSQDGAHILRLSGFSSDTELVERLKRSQADCSHLHIEPLKAQYIPVEKGVRQLINSYSGSLAGLSYLLGDAGLLLSANQNRLPCRKTLGLSGGNWFRTLAGVSYLGANLTLLGFGNSPSDNERDIVNQAARTLYTDSTHREKALPFIHDVYRTGKEFFAAHPWETASALSLAGCGLQAASGIANTARQGQRALWESVFSAGNVVALLIPLLVKEKGSHQALEAGNTDQFSHTLVAFANRHPALAPVAEAIGWVQEKPLTASARLSQAANLGHIGFGLRNRDLAYAGAYGSYFLGNTMQGMTHQSAGVGLDSLLEAAAEHLRTQPGTQAPAEKIHAMAQALSRQRGVGYRAHTLEEGLAHRLGSRHVPYLPEETPIMRHSPFLSFTERQQLEASARMSPPQR